MKTLPLSEVKARLSELVAHVVATDDEVTVTRKGRAAVVLISQDEYESWKETLAVRSSPALMREIRAGLRALRGVRRRYSPGELLGD